MLTAKNLIATLDFDINIEDFYLKLQDDRNLSYLKSSHVL